MLLNDPRKFAVEVAINCNSVENMQNTNRICDIQPLSHSTMLLLIVKYILFDTQDAQDATKFCSKRALIMQNSTWNLHQRNPFNWSVSYTWWNFAYIITRYHVLIDEQYWMPLKKVELAATFVKKLKNKIVILTRIL